MCGLNLTCSNLLAFVNCHFIASRGIGFLFMAEIRLSLFAVTLKILFSTILLLYVRSVALFFSDAVAYGKL
jgi:hypothetical protein